MKTLTRSRLMGAATFAAAILVAILSRATAPAGRYQISSGTVATVLDTETGLTWQQNVFSQTFSSATDATSYCASLGSGWRVPTLKELATIIDFSVASPGPTIDGTAFPNTPTTQVYQTATAFGSDLVWSVDFSDGTLCDNCGACGDSGSTCFVRCVR
jgi:hypothetical protein